MSAEQEMKSLAAKEALWSPEQKEKVERLEQEKCPACHEVSLAMLTWPNCTHKICLQCGDHIVRALRPRCTLVWEQQLTIQMNFARAQIQCPLCRREQSSAFFGEESSLLSAFRLPNNDWKIAMQQRLKDVQMFDVQQGQLPPIRCVKCALSFENLDACLAHISRCSENTVSCGFCHTPLPPHPMEKGVMDRVVQHLSSQCIAQISCNFRSCRENVDLCKMQQHREIHTRLVLFGDQMASGKYNIEDLDQLQTFLAETSNWKKIREDVRKAAKTRVVLPIFRITTPEEEVDQEDTRAERIHYEDETHDVDMEEDDEEEQDEEEDESDR
jgi:hypothetical protein